MPKQRFVEISVGALMMVGIFALIMLALQVSGLSHTFSHNGYYVTAVFDNVGDLKARAPVSMAGVTIGRVSAIELNPNTYQADVTLYIDEHFHSIPSDSAARILTQGLLGSNYISLDPGFSNAFLKNGDKITSTHSALILENLIGQFMFKASGNDNASGQSKKS